MYVWGGSEGGGEGGDLVCMGKGGRGSGTCEEGRGGDLICMGKG